MHTHGPRGIFQTRVYRFDGLQTLVPGYPGLIMSVRRAAGTISGQLSEAELRVVDYKLHGGQSLDGSWK